MTQKTYVLTGGPCTGKTTLLNKLAETGYRTLPEAARDIIEEEQKKEHGALPWTDFELFEKKIYERQVNNEHAAKNYQGTIFLDRGVPDIAGYYKATGRKAPSWLESAVQKHRYNAVFILDQLPENYFQNDSARKENREEANKIHQGLYAAYKESGYEPIKVPFGVDRKKFIEEKISELEEKVAADEWTKADKEYANTLLASLGMQEAA